MQRWVLVALGSVFVGLGMLGLFLPMLPTTPFLLLAACYAKSSQAFYDWLINNCYLGGYIRNPREKAAPAHQDCGADPAVGYHRLLGCGRRPAGRSHLAAPHRRRCDGSPGAAQPSPVVRPAQPHQLPQPRHQALRSGGQSESAADTILMGASAGSQVGGCPYGERQSRQRPGNKAHPAHCTISPGSWGRKPTGTARHTGRISAPAAATYAKGSPSVGWRRIPPQTAARPLKARIPIHSHG